MQFPASITLGTILRNMPDFYRSPHKIREIMFAYRYGYADPLWPKAGAVFAHFRAAMETYEARGRGNKAQRQLLRILEEKNLNPWKKNRSIQSSNTTICNDPALSSGKLKLRGIA